MNTVQPEGNMFSNNRVPFRTAVTRDPRFFPTPTRSLHRLKRSVQIPISEQRKELRLEGCSRIQSLDLKTRTWLKMFGRLSVFVNQLK